MIKPIRNQLLVEVLPPPAEQMVGGIHIPGASDSGPIRATVVALGSAEFDVKVGDTVLVERFAGNEVQQDGKKFIVLGEDGVLGILE